VTHADDVANVADITSDLDDLDWRRVDDPYGDSSPGRVRLPSTAADRSFTVCSRDGTDRGGHLAEQRRDLQLTLHQGDWRPADLAAGGLRPGPDAELPVLVGEISTTLPTVDWTRPPNGGARRSRCTSPSRT
jgi:hypothetical protein